MVNLVPCPRTDSTSIWPFIVSMTRFDHIHPDATSRLMPTASAVENPGRKMNFDDFASGRVSATSRLTSPQPDGLCLDFSDVETRAVIFDLDQDRVATMRGVQVNRAGLRLALDTADGGRFNAGGTRHFWTKCTSGSTNRSTTPCRFRYVHRK